MAGVRLSRMWATGLWRRAFVTGIAISGDNSFTTTYDAAANLTQTVLGGLSRTATFSITGVPLTRKYAGVDA